MAFPRSLEQRASLRRITYLLLYAPTGAWRGDRRAFKDVCTTGGYSRPKNRGGVLVWGCGFAWAGRYAEYETMFGITVMESDNMTDDINLITNN